MARYEEIQARLAEINTQIDTADGETLTALETESRSLMEELTDLKQTAQARQQLRKQIAEGAGQPLKLGQPSQTLEERTAQHFVQTRRMTLNAEQSRATLVSGGTLATPTAVDGIYDIPGAKVSSIIDMVRVVNCVGMGSHKIAYQATDAAAAPVQTEGANTGLTQSLGTFGFVTISPTSVAVLDGISKQAQRQTPLQYAAKVRDQALIALRREAAALVTEKLKASTLNATVDATVTSTKGVVDATTLRKLVLAYGGDESVVGGAVLFLNKADLMAFGDVRGTNEKRAVYEITPDMANPNTGLIRDGGLSVRYCLNSHLTACHGTAQAESATVTMIYGSPMNLELDLFSDYEVRVSEDFAFDKLMDTIRGDVELGADVIAKHGFVALTIPATA